MSKVREGSIPAVEAADPAGTKPQIRTPRTGDSAVD
jgi:hypothetical protein